MSLTIFFQVLVPTIRLYNKSEIQLTLSQLFVGTMAKSCLFRARLTDIAVIHLQLIFWFFLNLLVFWWCYESTGEHAVGTGDLAITATNNSARIVFFFLKVITIYKFITILIYTPSTIKIILSPFLQFKPSFKEKN